MFRRQLDGPVPRERHAGKNAPVLHVVGQEGGQLVQDDSPLGPGENECDARIEKLEVFEGLCEFCSAEGNPRTL